MSSLEDQRPAEREWNRMLVLDACRYDCFEEVNTIEGELKKMNSHSRHTRDWYEQYWRDRNNDDTIYITNQPQLWVKEREVIAHSFYENYPLWKRDDWLDFDSTLSRINELKNDNNNRRELIHVLPPHQPWRSPLGKRLRERLNLITDDNTGEDYNKIERWARGGNWDTLRSVYKREIKWALEKIQEHNIEPDVITADHGERLGEENKYNHNSSHRSVLEVPWLSIK